MEEKRTKKNSIRRFLSVPSEIRADFWQEAVRKNRISMSVICVLIFFMELYNMTRILFMTESGLGTANNRFYFGMYLALFLFAAVYLVLQHLLKTASTGRQWVLQAISVALCLLWFVCLNAYDLIFHSPAGTYTYVTAIVGLAMFIQLPFACSIFYFAGGYLLFMLLCGRMLDAGNTINITMMTIVAQVISITQAHHISIELCQRREINRTNEQLQRLLQRDPLTGIYNKTAAENLIAGALEHAEQEEGAAVFMLDLDDFKNINDNYGHPCGDHVLKETADRLRAVFPDAVCVGRVGGDEFISMLLGRFDTRELAGRGEKLIRELSEIRWMGQKLHVGCSVGIIWVSGGHRCYEQLYQEADQALYEAKRAGKGRCCLRELS